MYRVCFEMMKYQYSETDSNNNLTSISVSSTPGVSSMWARQGKIIVLSAVKPREIFSEVNPAAPADR